MPRKGLALLLPLIFLLFMAVNHTAHLPVYSAPGSSDLVINEVDYDQPGIDMAEYIELKNVSATAVNAADYLIYLVNGYDDAIYHTITLPAVWIPPGGFFTICANPQTMPDCDWYENPTSNLIQNGPPDAVALVQNSVIVDVVSYEGSVPGYVEVSGSNVEDDPDEDYAGIGRYPDGYDSDNNNQDFFLLCDTPGKANIAVSAFCRATITPTLTPTPISSPTPGTPTPLPPTAEVTHTPSPTPTPSITPSPTNTPFPPTPTRALVMLPFLKSAFRSQEPNDNPAQANGPIASHETVTGNFPLGDTRNDYFYFDMPLPYTIYATLTHIPAGQDYDLVIRDAQMQVLGYSGQYDNADEAALTVMVYPGRYYIQVYNFLETPSDANYWLRVVYEYSP